MKETLNVKLNRAEILWEKCKAETPKLEDFFFFFFIVPNHFDCLNELELFTMNFNKLD